VSARFCCFVAVLLLTVLAACSVHCRCEADKYVATFSAVRPALIYILGTLHEAGRAINKECGIIAAAQVRYDRMMAAIGARNGVGAVGYLARDFVSVQLWGRR